MDNKYVIVDGQAYMEEKNKFYKCHVEKNKIEITDEAEKIRGDLGKHYTIKELLARMFQVEEKSDNILKNQLSELQESVKVLQNDITKILEYLLPTAREEKETAETTESSGKSK